MSPSMYFTIFLLLFPILLLLIMRRRKLSNKLPPGSLGIPFIGQSLDLLRAMRTNTAEKWLEERARKYGPISKLTLFGTPTVFVRGKAANKFVFNNDGEVLGNNQPKSIARIMGSRNILELNGEDHRRVRGALLTFLKPEVLKKYVGKMDKEVRNHLKVHWQGKTKITIMPLMKTLTFDIMCSLLFGLESGDKKRETFVKYFMEMIEGMWTIPVNLPFTRFNRSIRASTKAQSLVMGLIREKREALLKQQASPSDDLILSLLCITGEDNKPALSDKEIVDNVMIVMLAGFDTSSVLLTFLVRLLINDPFVYAAVLREHEEIAEGKKSGEELTWEDLSKMKYTWRVANETLRMTPPVFGGFRKALKDLEFEGYLIPKGWQVFWVANMTHMDETIFPNPSKFDPSRFDQQTPVPPFCYVAFGGGPRVCPGYEFARLEVLVSVHYMVTMYNWKFCLNDNSFIRDPMPLQNQGLPILIEPKKSF
ncbi:hypothetical protein GIB67_039393 [Kingdonia uniflora]|uniref:Cytochrome P450 n=1 Tax=Kingdonia uniflora TaxID=39325 RepID=A0A7J7L7W8_9MAGN|nr:hypothetical protein GIB67_001247 [Kingdonia uniflora]KAF6152205.1 hypothetical protein GIB67_039393 [Kingdonia uniflora]